MKRKEILSRIDGVVALSVICDTKINLLEKRSGKLVSVDEEQMMATVRGTLKWVRKILSGESEGGANAMENLQDVLASAAKELAFEIEYADEDD